MTTPQWEFRTISIDFDVFKTLTAKLESPTDTYNDVLRRELGLGLPKRAAVTSNAPPPTAGPAWVSEGVEFPDGTEFRAHYKGQQYFATVQNGVLMYQNRKQSSLSAAAIAVTNNSVNGWRFWECRFPGRNGWQDVDGLRRKR